MGGETYWHSMATTMPPLTPGRAPPATPRERERRAAEAPPSTPTSATFEERERRRAQHAAELAEREQKRQLGARRAQDTKPELAGVEAPPTALGQVQPSPRIQPSMREARAVSPQREQMSVRQAELVLQKFVIPTDIASSIKSFVGLQKQYNYRGLADKLYKCR